MTKVLFEPVAIGGLSLANRIVMAPMTRSFSTGGVPGPTVAAYYERRAANAVGLIITEGTVVAHPAAANDPNVPRFHGTDALAGWERVRTAVHAAGGKIAPQLWHTGILRRLGSEPNPDVKPVAPSGISKPGKQVVEPMSEREIADVIAAFAQGASDARRLGFDAIEIHAAHGYLIDQFFWDQTNVRGDRFGGNAVARTTFAAEIVKACRRATAPAFPIILRFSQWKQQDYAARLAPTPQALEAWLAPLVDAGVDIFHASTRRFWTAEFDGSDMNLAGWTKKLTGKAVITVGSVGLEQDFIETFRAPEARQSASHLARLDEMVARGDVDLVAVGRALIADPAFALKLSSRQLDALKPYSVEALKTLI